MFNLFFYNLNQKVSKFFVYLISRDALFLLLREKKMYALSYSATTNTDAINVLYQKLFADTGNEIKSTLKLSLHRPYLQVKV